MPDGLSVQVPQSLYAAGQFRGVGNVAADILSELASIGTSYAGNDEYGRPYVETFDNCVSAGKDVLSSVDGNMHDVADHLETTVQAYHNSDVAAADLIPAAPSRL